MTSIDLGQKALAGLWRSHPSLRAFPTMARSCASYTVRIPLILVPASLGVMAAPFVALTFVSRANLFSPLQFGIFLASLWILVAARLDNRYVQLRPYVDWAAQTGLMGLGLLGTVVALMTGQGATMAERLRSVDFSLAFVTTADGLVGALALTLLATALHVDCVKGSPVDHGAGGTGA